MALMYYFIKKYNEKNLLQNSSLERLKLVINYLLVTDLDDLIFLK